MPDLRRATSLALTAFVLSCSGGDDNPSGPGDTTPPTELPQQPNPANATVTSDASRAASTRMTTGGGTMEATGADGTIYTLTLPANALVADTTITMTPLTDVAGLDLSGGRFVGVQLEPEGLRFFQDVILRISPPEGAHHSAVGFSYHGAGSEIHRVPLTPSPDLLEIHLMHFSGAAIYVGDGIYISPAVENITPSEWEDRILSYIEDILRDDRERALNGEAPDPNRDLKLLDAFQGYYELVIEPSMAQMTTDCEFAQTAVPRTLAWEHNVEVWGFHDELAAQEETARAAIVKATENCFNTTKGDCLDTSDRVQMSEAIGYTRQLALLGVQDEAYNALNPDLHCSVGWAGTTNRTNHVIDGVSDVLSVEVHWELDPEHSDPGVGTRYRVKQGSIHWERNGVDAAGCTHQGGPQSFDIKPEEGAIVFDEINHTYQVTGISGNIVTLPVTCPAPLRSYSEDVLVGDWVVTPVLPLPDNATVLSGSYDYPGLSTTYVWEFRR
jgi:hypothetical protein